MFDKANEPAPSEGGRPRPDALIGKLLIIRIVEHSPDNPIGITRTSKNAETGLEIKTPADCIIADVVDLDDENQPVFYDYIFLQSKLIQHFRTNIGKTLVGTLGQHPGQGDRKGAYYFTDRSEIRREVAVAEAWVANHPEFFTSQAPGNTARKSNAPVANGGEPEPESAGSGSTLETMRRQGNSGDEAPF